MQRKKCKNVENFKNKKLQKISSLLMECNIEGKITEEDCFKKIQKLVTKKRTKRKISKHLAPFRKMPELYHKFPNQDFDAEKSEVYKWIAEQEELMNWFMYNIGGNDGLIKYNKVTGKWHGVKQGDQE